MSDPIEQTLRELRCSDRPIVRQRLLQDASNRLTPDQVTALYLRLDAELGPETCLLAPHFDKMTTPLRIAAARSGEWSIADDDGPIILFRATEAPVETKRLYILIGGTGGQYFLSLSYTLALLPPGPKDVMVLRRPPRHMFLVGVEGLGPTPRDIAAALETRYQIGRYRHLCVIGISLGGIVAMRIAEHLRADIGVSFSGLFASDVLTLNRKRSLGVTAFDPLCACRPQSIGRLVSVVPSKLEVDVRAQAILRGLRPRLVPIEVFLSGKHNTLLTLDTYGQAGRFLELLLAEQSRWLRLVSRLSTGIGWSVRRLRWLTGQQRTGSWYDRKG